MPEITHILAPLDHPIGEKVNIRGGGGKTTLGKALSVKYSYSFIELVAIFWLPEWVERETDDFKVKVQEAINTSRGGWIVDGNYSSRLESLVTDQCDTVIWIDLSWSVMFWRITLRAIFRAITREKICGENIESWRQMFSGNSLLWYWIKNRRSYLSKGENMEILLNALDINVKASRDKVQINGSVPNVPETDENFVTIVQTSA